jgi:hypothetical protein
VALVADRAVGAWPQFLAWLALLLAIVCAAPAGAHLIPAGEATINVVGARAYLVLSIPNAAFADDGATAQRLTQNELHRRGDDLRSQIRDGIWVSSGGQRAAVETILLNLASPDGTQAHGHTAHEGHEHGHHATAQGDDLVAMVVVAFDEPPTSVLFESSLWGDVDAQLSVGATVSEGPRTLRSELGVLTPNRHSHFFFATNEDVFASAAHRTSTTLLLRWDHVGFVAALLLLGVSVRRSARVGVTLALGYAIAFGLVAYPWLSFVPLSQDLATLATVGTLGVAGALHLVPRMRTATEIGVLLFLGVTQGLGVSTHALAIGHADTLLGARVLGETVGAGISLCVITVLVGGGAAFVRVLRQARERREAQPT